MGCCKSRRRRVEPAGFLDSLALVTTSTEDIRDKYELGRVLGSGSFGQVREAKLRMAPSHVRAVKIVESDKEDNRAMFVSEAGLLKQSKHKHIIQYFDVYADDEFLYVVMQLCRGGELFNKIVELKRFAEKDAAVIGKQMLEAIQYIHSINIIHRDIKAENFMLEHPTWPSPVKMIDFGMACKFEVGEVLTELCGSPHYLAPEVIGQRYNYLADVWAFGVLMYLTMYGRYPYDSEQSQDIMAKIVNEPVEWSTNVKLSSDAGQFLKKLLEHNPRRRVNASQALEQSWIIGCTDDSNAVDEALPAEVVHSAHRKVTAQRKQVDHAVEEHRNRKLQKIDDDYGRGIARGKRLGDVCVNEGFVTKPEFVRREKKLYSAPSNQIALSRLTEQVKADNKQAPELVQSSSSFSLSAAASTSAGLSGITREPALTAATRDHIPRTRSNSLCNPRRLTYMGHISDREDDAFHNLYFENNFALAGSSVGTVEPEAVPEIIKQTPSFNRVVATEELV